MTNRISRREEPRIFAVAHKQVSFKERRIILAALPLFVVLMSRLHLGETTHYTMTRIGVEISFLGTAQRLLTINQGAEDNVFNLSYEQLLFVLQAKSRLSQVMIATVLVVVRLQGQADLVSRGDMACITRHAGGGGRAHDRARDWAPTHSSSTTFESRAMQYMSHLARQYFFSLILCSPARDFSYS